MNPPYPYMNGTAITSDLSQLLIYMNLVTDGYFIPAMVIFFFLVTLITSLIMQQRFTGYMRFETSLLAASFVSTGLCLLLLMKGLIVWQWTLISVAIFLLSLYWVAESSNP